MYALLLALALSRAGAQETVAFEPLESLDEVSLSGTDWGRFPGGVGLGWLRPNRLADAHTTIDTVLVFTGRPHPPMVTAFSDLPMLHGAAARRQALRAVREGDLQCAIVLKGRFPATTGFCSPRDAKRYGKQSVLFFATGIFAVGMGTAFTVWAALEDDPLAWLAWGILGTPVLLLSGVVTLAASAPVYAVAGQRAEARRQLSLRVHF